MIRRKKIHSKLYYYTLNIICSLSLAKTSLLEKQTHYLQEIINLSIPKPFVLGANDFFLINKMYQRCLKKTLNVKKIIFVTNKRFLSGSLVTKMNRRVVLLSQISQGFLYTPKYASQNPPSKSEQLSVVRTFM